MNMIFKHQSLSITYIAYLKLLGNINWRKTTAILLCLMLAFGHIPASSSALSNHVMDLIVGYGLSESSVETTNTENGVADTSSSETNENTSDTNLLKLTDESAIDESEQVLSKLL